MTVSAVPQTPVPASTVLPGPAAVPSTTPVDVPSRKSSGNKHIPALDGLRGLAILTVLVFHFSQGVFATNESGPSRILSILCGAGWVGVDLFFVLSGFLITSILCEAKGSAGYFKNFYMRRVLRIFPLYYGVLAVAFLILPLFWTWNTHKHDRVVTEHQWALWLYLQNFVSIDWFRFTHFWSLAVEEHFYMVWPAVVFLLPRRAAMVFCGVLIAAAIAIRTGIVLTWTDQAAARDATYLWTICRMDGLAMGGLLALAAHNPAGPGVERFRKAGPWVFAAGAAACAALLVYYGSFFHGHAGIETFGFTIVAVTAAALLVLCVTSPKDSILGRVFGGATLRFLGKYSYGIYVFHGFIAVLVRFGLDPALVWLGVGNISTTQSGIGPKTLDLVLRLVIGTVASVSLALLSWHLYEKHFLKLKRFFEYRAPVLEGFKPNEPVKSRQSAVGSGQERTASFEAAKN